MKRETDLDARNDAQYLMNQLDVIRGYKEYVPDEVLVAEPESDRFERAIENAERTLAMMDPDDLREFKEALREKMLGEHSEEN